MSSTINLGASWRYSPRFEGTFVDPGFDPSGWEVIDIPHANLELPYNGFDEKSYQFVSTYLRDLELPALTGGRRAFLEFEGVMAACELWVNGVAAGSHVGGYTAFSLELGPFVKEGANRIVLRVDSTERSDIPPFGHVIDYLCYGGVYRGVNLHIREAAFIADVFAMASLDSAGSPRLGVEVGVDRGESAPAAGKALAVRAVLRDGGRTIAEASTRVDEGGKARLSFPDLPGVRPWDLDDPALYDLEVSLVDGIAVYDGGPEIDAARRRIGFRSAQWRGDGFFLNGRRVKIAGLNRHQSWPYSGYAMPARAQAADAEILKRGLGVNLVRTSHYPQAKAFLDACDELGLLVFEELPGWQHLGGAAWKDNACAALEEMILRDRSRPSIVLWGTRINESRDDHDFYARTNEIAHRLDPTRQNGGVRYLERSEFLEDVYTFNDFVHNGVTRALRRPRKVTGLRRDVPFLVTEHNGHMFPTKRFDNEERLREHALRHARVLDAAYGDPGVSGAIGWCAFDYNTHKDFGSGDRICYHGVSDMFRLPKYAAAVYASQRDIASLAGGGKAGVVLEAASLFAKGERSAALTLPVEIYTNCDEIALFHGGVRIGAFRPDRAAFPNLPHPPVIVRDIVGDQLAGGRFSARDQARLRRLIAKVLSVGLEGLGLLDKLAIGLLLLRNRMGMPEAEELVGRFAMGWGAEDQSWEVVGFAGGKEVARRSYGGDAVATRLVARPGDGTLLAEGIPTLADGASTGEAWDCTRVAVRLEDQYGNLCPFGAEVIEFEVTGPGRLIGPSRMPLIGGCLAAWVRTTGRTGTIQVRVRGGRFEAETLSIQVG